jgi:hypothetical protein
MASDRRDQSSVQRISVADQETETAKRGLGDKGGGIRWVSLVNNSHSALSLPVIRDDHILSCHLVTLENSGKIL